MDTDHLAGLRMVHDSFRNYDGNNLFDDEQDEIVMEVIKKTENHETISAIEYCSKYHITVLIQEAVLHEKGVDTRRLAMMKKLAPLDFSETIDVKPCDLDIDSMTKKEIAKRTAFLKKYKDGYTSNEARISDLWSHYNTQYGEILEHSTIHID